MDKNNLFGNWFVHYDGEKLCRGEATFVIIKPDAVARGLIGEIIGRFEAKGLEIAAMTFGEIRPEQARALYEEHKDKPFFERLVGFTVSGPSVRLILRGNQAIKVVRAMMGATDSTQAAPGTIRGDLALTSFEKTLVHGSRTPEDFNREWTLFDWGNGCFSRRSYRSDRNEVYSDCDK